LVNPHLSAPWIVCQYGAREHYAIARGLHRIGVPVTLVTDYWQYRKAWRLHRKLSQRRHDEFPDSAVISFNLRRLQFEASLRAKRMDAWQFYLAIGEWFGRLAAERVAGVAGRETVRPIVFAYSYAALQIFKTAKDFGCRTILGQIDPGPEEERIVWEAARQANIPFYARPPAKYWENWRRECELADSIIVNSRWSHSCLVNAGIETDKIQTIELAYEASPGRATEIRTYPDQFSHTRPLRILFLGQVIVRKGVYELAAAARHLSAHPIEWHVVGGGEPEAASLLRSIPSVVVHGGVSRGEVEAFYRSADVFILPTHSDGYALTLLEAASYGLPIIASTHCGDVVENGVNGIQLERVDEASIVAAVQQLLDHPGDLAKMNTAQLKRPIRDLDALSADLRRIVDSLQDNQPSCNES
jgi:glycosyltransferase involved in cell wall biosynthesis